MRLTSYTDYAFRVLIFLALRREAGSTIQEIAEHYAISRNHLMKVVQQLGQLGYVETTRGRGGGLRLAVEPADLRLGDLVRHTEEDMTLVECFDRESNQCVISGVCRLQSVLSDALKAWLAVMDSYTLADLVTNPVALRKAIAMAPAGR